MNPDLRAFVNQVLKEKPDDVLVVKESLDLRYETFAYIDGLAKRGRHPIFIFENLQGAKFPVVANVLGTRNRYALALGTTEDRIRKEWLSRSQGAIPPQIVQEAPIKECMSKGEEVNLSNDVAGSFLGEPLEVIACETVDLEVPGQAEIILEGEILADAREDEGPFGEYTGYSSRNSTRHVMKVKAITHRRDALFQDIVPGFSREHNGMLAIPSESRLLEVLRRVVPSVQDVSYPFSGLCRFHCYVSMKKVAEGDPKTAILSAFAEDTYLKLVIVVDEDIDVHCEEEVLWAMATRMQADEGVFVVPGVMGAQLDLSPKEDSPAKMGIDATRPLTGWKATRCAIPEAVRTKINQRLANN